MKRYLVMYDRNQLPDGYDEYVVMGDRFTDAVKWCEKNSKICCIVPENWHGGGDSGQAELYLKKVREDITMWLSDSLNEYHHTNYDYQKWAILIYP